MPAVSTERIHLFLAPYSASDRTGPGGGLAHEGEDIAVEVLPLDALARMVDEGALPDMKTVLLAPGSPPPTPGPLLPLTQRHQR